MDVSIRNVSCVVFVVSLIWLAAIDKAHIIAAANTKYFAFLATRARLISFFIFCTFELLNVSNFVAKLRQKPIYIQILRFIFALRKLLKYRRMEKEKFICGFVGFI